MITDQSPTAVPAVRRHRRIGPRRYRGRLQHRPFVRRARPPAPTPPPLPELERQRRVEIVARKLVRTMRSVPAPGLEPLTWRDWLVVYGVVVATGFVVMLLTSAGR